MRLCPSPHHDGRWPVNLAGFGRDGGVPVPEATVRRLAPAVAIDGVLASDAHQPKWEWVATSDPMANIAKATGLPSWSRVQRQSGQSMIPTRRELLRLGLLAGLSSMGRTQSGTSASRQPASLGPEEGELLFVGQDPVRIKVSPQGDGGRLAMITQDVSPGTIIPVHLHEREDEIIFIQSGTGEATLGDNRVSLSAGSVLFVPQGTWHGGRNTSATTLRWVAIYSPSGFEGYFREIGRPSPDAPRRALTQTEALDRDERYGIRYR